MATQPPTCEGLSTVQYEKPCTLDADHNFVIIRRTDVQCEIRTGLTNTRLFERRMRLVFRTDVYSNS